MPRRIVDLSVPLMEGVVSDPPGMRPEINYLNHRHTAPGVAKFMDLAVAELPDGIYAATEECSVSTHHGTHLDAPYHFFPTMNHALREGGEPAWRIDEVPLDWCFQPAVKLDFRRFDDGYLVQPSDVEAELARIGHTLRPLEIVVVNTRAGTRYGEEDFLDAGCGIGRAATLWLLERGVRVTGTDAWSWDAPFSITRERVKATGDAALIFEGHRAGREIGYSHLEKLQNLECLPPDGFTVACFPIKVHRASAGWARAVAIFDE